MEPSDVISIVISTIALAASFLSLAISLVRHFDKIATANYEAIYWFILGLPIFIFGTGWFLLWILVTGAAISDRIGITDMNTNVPLTSIRYYLSCLGGFLLIGLGLFLIEKAFKPYRDQDKS